MADQIMRELETSAEIMMASPTLVSSEQRHCAESVFLNFQKTKSPYDMCQYILTNSKSDYVQFQAASLLKQAIIREWKLMEKPQVEQLKTGLMNFVMQNTSLQSYVREILLLVVAIMVKRSSVDDGSEVVTAFLTEVSKLIVSGDSSMQTIGCSILTSLLHEFSSSTKATDIGLTWETHLNAKKNFEKTDLKRVFQFVLQGLSELNKIGPNIPPETTKLLKRFLMIAEQVLTWNFQFDMALPWRLVGMFESQMLPALRPHAEWREVFLDPSVVPLFYKLHWQVRENPDLCHHTLQCFHQMASLNGAVVYEQEDRCAYLGRFVENLLNLLSSGPLRDYEVIGISNMISRLHVFFTATYMTSLQNGMLPAYLLKVTDLTCYLAERAAQEQPSQEDKVFSEAFDHMTEAWTTILRNSEFYPEEVIRQSSLQIFNHYLKTHLATPDGTRPINSSTKEEIDEVEEDDRVKYRDQLQAIGMFGRIILDQSLPFLTMLLEDRIIRLHGQLDRMHQGPSGDFAFFEALHEDLHWLVMLSGHVLSTFLDCDPTLIPPEVVSLSVAKAQGVHLASTLEALTSPSRQPSRDPGAEQALDPVVRLIAAVFRLCEVEKRAMEAQLTHLLSPEVALSLVWFIARFSVTYLMPDESYYRESQISLALCQAFGRDSEAGMWTLDFLIGKLESNLTYWSGETKLVTETAITLTYILRDSERGAKAIKCSSMLNFIHKQCNGAYQSLPTTAKRSILRCLVIVGDANTDPAVKDSYFQQLFKPLQTRFEGLLRSPSFAATYQTKEVQREVMDLVECFTGVLDGHSVRVHSVVLPVIAPFFRELPRLVDAYHNHPEVVVLVLQAFCVAAKRVLCIMSEEDTKTFFICCADMITVYAKHNAGKLSREANAEEDQYRDLFLLMQLLTDVIFRDFIQDGMLAFFKSGENDGAASSGEQVFAADVSLMGLNAILPLMNADLLSFPGLCNQYFKLLVSICEVKPDKVCESPDSLVKSMLSSIQFGLTSCTTDVSTYCFNFISVLGLHIHRSNLQHLFIYTALEPFLKIVFDMLITQPLVADKTQVASGSLYTLICCYQQKYQELVQELINGQSDPVSAQRLLGLFTALSERMSLSLDRQSRIFFRDNFEKFLTEVRGFLCVK